MLAARTLPATPQKARMKACSPMFPTLLTSSLLEPMDTPNTNSMVQMVAEIEVSSFLKSDILRQKVPVRRPIINILRYNILSK